MFALFILCLVKHHSTFAYPWWRCARCAPQCASRQQALDIIHVNPCENPNKEHTKNQTRVVISGRCTYSTLKIAHILTIAPIIKRIFFLVFTVFIPINKCIKKTAEFRLTSVPARGKSKQWFTRKKDRQRSYRCAIIYAS